MSYNVLAIPPFDRQLKRLSKKYPSLKKEYSQLLDNLQLKPKLGITIGSNCYKVRLSIESKGKGKSGGARVITNFVIAEKSVYLLSIYDKSERDNLPDNELRELLKFVPR